MLTYRRVADDKLMPVMGQLHYLPTPRPRGKLADWDEYDLSEKKMSAQAWADRLRIPGLFGPASLMLVATAIACAICYDQPGPLLSHDQSRRFWALFLIAVIVQIPCLLGHQHQRRCLREIEEELNIRQPQRPQRRSASTRNPDLDF